MKVTGGVLNLEISDDIIEKYILSAFREIQRYIDTTRIVTIPYSKCINMKEYSVSSIARVYRTDGNGTSSSETTTSDPMSVAQWQLMSGNIYNYQNYVYNFAAYNTMLQTRNTVSTDLSFIYDKTSDNLYINMSSGIPANITVEFVPKYKDVNEIVSDFWIDVLLRMSVAATKIALGRIRSRFNQSNALWAQDGETMLAEGNSEMSELRAALVANTQLVYPCD